MDVQDALVRVSTLREHPFTADAVNVYGACFNVDLACKDLFKAFANHLDALGSRLTMVSRQFRNYFVMLIADFVRFYHSV